MEMMEAMLEFLQQCPSLADMDHHVDYGEGENCWMLHDCGEELLSLYWDGSRRKMHSYSLEIRMDSFTDSERIANTKLMESITAWLSEQSDLEQLPELPEGKESLKLDCENGEIGSVSEDGMEGNYHLTLNLTYVERGAVLAS